MALEYQEFRYNTFKEYEGLAGNPIKFIKKLVNNFAYVIECLADINSQLLNKITAVKKVYTAFLSQPAIVTTSGLLVEGKTYLIETLIEGDDFVNVGYVEAGTAFVATGTTPTAWTNGTEVQNITDWVPVASPLQDQLSGPVFSRTSAGTFMITKADAFTEGKTLPRKDIYTDQDGNVLKLTWTSKDVLTLETFAASDTETAADGVLNDHSITIEVYI